MPPVKIVLLPDGKLPVRKTTHAAGYDVYASDTYILRQGDTRLIPLGFKIAIPEGYYATITGRSGLAKDGVLSHTGIIDSDYRDEVGIILCNPGGDWVVKKGDRIGQLVFHEQLTPEFTEELILEPAQSNRTGGFGSTGS